MVTTRRVDTGSRSGSGASKQIGSDELDARIIKIHHGEVVAIARDQIPELFGSIKTAMMELFDYRNAAVASASTTVTTAGVGPGQVF